MRRTRTKTDRLFEKNAGVDVKSKILMATVATAPLAIALAWRDSGHFSVRVHRFEGEMSGT